MSDTSDKITFTIDGISLSVPKGTTVYTAAKELGIDIPIFCYDDRMPPFGACRMCLVEVDKMPKLQTSCTLVATEGMAVSTHSNKTKAGREDILELLLINHPLDCPICDKGGECPLQDQAMKFGPERSRFHEEKRHFKKPIPLGPVLMLDRERCVVCARCTRFSEIVSGDHALQFIDRGYKTEVGTPGGGPAESKFIGNTISICPVGALTSRVYRFRARPWDNTSTPTTCTLCPVGCSMILDSRDGEVMRTRACENKAVNDVWLCDKGWFGYEFSDSPERLMHPLIRRSGKLEPATWEEALELVASKIRSAKGNAKIAGWGGNPLTTEENYLFQKLIREGAGVNHLDHRIGIPIVNLDEEGLAPGMEISIGECESLSVVILLGVDITEEFPIIWLRLKHAINNGAKVLFFGNFAPEIAPQLHKVVLHPPGKEIETLQKHLPEIQALMDAGKTSALFVGRQYLNTPQRTQILSELTKLKEAHPTVSLNILEGKDNSFGARWAGMRPDVGPENKTLKSPGLNAPQVLEVAAKSGWDFLYIAGANPAVKFPSKLWAEARKKLGFLVVQDLFLNQTAQQADVVLPTLCYVEKSGCFINIEGRIQQLRPGKILPDSLLSDEDIFILLGSKLRVNLAFDRSFVDSLDRERISIPAGKISKFNSPSTSSVSLGAVFTPLLFDKGVRMRHNPHLGQLAKDPYVRLSPAEGFKRNIHDGDSVQIKANGNAITAKVKLDKRVAEGTLVLPLGFDEVPVHNLAMTLVNGLAVELTKMN